MYQVWSLFQGTALLEWLWIKTSEKRLRTSSKRLSDIYPTAHY